MPNTDPPALRVVARSRAEELRERLPFDIVRLDSGAELLRCAGACFVAHALQSGQHLWTCDCGTNCRGKPVRDIRRRPRWPCQPEPRHDFVTGHVDRDGSNVGIEWRWLPGRDGAYLLVGQRTMIAGERTDREIQASCDAGRDLLAA